MPRQHVVSWRDELLVPEVGFPQSAVCQLQPEAALSGRKFPPDVSKIGLDFGIVACGIAFGL